MKLTFYNILILLFSWLCLDITARHYQENIMNKKMEQEANKINNILSDYFEYVNDVNVIMGKQIAKNGAKNLNLILDIFRDNVQHYMISNQNSIVNNKLFSWSTYDWVDDQNYQTVNAKIGIRTDNPSDMSARRYTLTARVAPWTLQFDSPALGIPSNRWVIPVATGVADKNNKYLGAIAVGINIGLLSNNLEERLNSGLSFVVADKNANISLTSSLIDDKKEKDIKFDLAKYAINTRKYPKSDTSDEIKYRPITADNITFKHIKYMQNYPFMILVGYDEEWLDYEVAKIVRPSMILMLFLLISCNLFFFLEKTELKLKRNRN